MSPPTSPRPSSMRTFIERKCGEVPLLVIDAIFEWVIIAILFFDGLFSFISDEFAKLCNLRIPCLLCTRIDHVLVPREPSFYYNESICDIHKKDISSLAYCHVHRKLSDIRTMCQGCLLSFATGRDSACDNQSLAGMMHKDGSGQEVSSFRSFAWWCSCCGEPLKMKAPAPPKKKFGRTLSMGKNAMASPRASRLGSKNDDVMVDASPRFKGRPIRTSSSFDVDDGLDDDAMMIESPRWANRVTTKPPVMELNDGDGNNVGRLKKQLNSDQKTLLALQEELDEERSAAAVAANNAMAMITRLQAEKAAVQMEALQYQRMMEEQAEYDEEALQVLRDMVVKREEEAKVLESELEMYREKYGPIEKVGNEICEVDIGPDSLVSDSGSSSGESDHSDDFDHQFEHDSKESQEGTLQKAPSSLDFEAERSHLLGLLAELEKKMSSNSTDQVNEEGEGGNKDTLMKEVLAIKERLKTIEAESGFLKHAAMTLQKGGEGTKLLSEIAQHLREGRPTDKLESNEIEKMDSDESDE